MTVSIWICKFQTDGIYSPAHTHTVGSEISFATCGLSLPLVENFNSLTKSFTPYHNISTICFNRRTLDAFEMLIYCCCSFYYFFFSYYYCLACHSNHFAQSSHFIRFLVLYFYFSLWFFSFILFFSCNSTFDFIAILCHLNVWGNVIARSVQLSSVCCSWCCQIEVATLSESAASCECVGKYLYVWDFVTFLLVFYTVSLYLTHNLHCHLCM